MQCGISSLLLVGMNTNTHTNNKTLLVEIRNNYGAPAVYPICETAKTFAEISGKKTMTHEVRALIKSLGYTFEQRTSKIDL